MEIQKILNKQIKGDTGLGEWGQLKQGCINTQCPF